MNVLLRTQYLKSIFSYEKEVAEKECPVEMIPFQFTQTDNAEEINSFLQLMPGCGFCDIPDNEISENKRFTYIIFTPRKKEKLHGAILLLHGLNERSWDKYLIWAEELAISTGKAVILFPLAFHMNRTPSNWYSPKSILPWVNKRKQQILNLCNSTFLNVALSSRLSENPLRFYTSGRESALNVCQLIHEIKSGNHPLFYENTAIDIFAYSIGALVSQVLLLANPEQMLNDSKIFLFCGGSVFNHMDGNAKDIMDKDAFDRLKDYFSHDFISEDIPAIFAKDNFEKAFKSMLEGAMHKEFRESVFEKAKNRIRVLCLKKDIVMPTSGIVDAFGSHLSKEIVEETDFPYDYTHQSPFPLHKTDPVSLNTGFSRVFYKAATFLA